MSHEIPFDPHHNQHLPAINPQFTNHLPLCRVEDPPWNPSDVSQERNLRSRGGWLAFAATEARRKWTAANEDPEAIIVSVCHSIDINT